jgi:hypothetical protein
MPGHYDIQPPERLVECTFCGSIGPADCIALIDRILGDPRYREGFSCLVDNRALETAFTPDQLRQVIPAVARAFAAMAPGPRIAVLVDRDVQYGLTRMFQSLSSDILNLNLRIFRDPAEARAWLAEGRV